MATWSVLTGRKLKPGAYDDWRKAWQPDEWPEGVRGYILRKIGDPDEAPLDVALLALVEPCR